jgi:hypothetical protein
MLLVRALLSVRGDDEVGHNVGLTCWDSPSRLRDPSYEILTSRCVVDARISSHRGKLAFWDTTRWVP